MLLTNIESIPGYEIETQFGVVSGSTVRSKNAFRDIAAGIKNFFGGELRGYTELLNEARQEATERMIKQAEKMGANAVINIRYATSSISAGAAEIYVYGTAVRVR